jgi:hypothetical protein
MMAWPPFVLNAGEFPDLRANATAYMNESSQTGAEKLLPHETKIDERETDRACRINRKAAMRMKQHIEG